MILKRNSVAVPFFFCNSLGLYAFFVHVTDTNVSVNNVAADEPFVTGQSEPPIYQFSPSAKYAVVNPLLENAFAPIVVTPLGIVMLVNLLHPLKAFVPIDTKLLGSLMLGRLLHPENVYGLIFVTPSGIFTSVKLLHPENAYEPIVATLLGIVIFFKFVHPSKALSKIVVTE